MDSIATCVHAASDNRCATAGSRRSSCRMIAPASARAARPADAGRRPAIPCGHRSRSSGDTARPWHTSNGEACRGVPQGESLPGVLLIPHGARATVWGAWGVALGSIFFRARGTRKRRPWPGALARSTLPLSSLCGCTVAHDHFFRMSRSSARIRFSLRSRASSSRSAVVRPVRPFLRSALACRTQLTSEDGVDPGRARRRRSSGPPPTRAGPRRRAIDRCLVCGCR